MTQQALFYASTWKIWKYLFIKIHALMFIAALFTMAKTWKQQKCPVIDRWLDKEDVVLMYNGILLSYKKRWNTAIFENIDGPWEHHTKQTKSKKVKNHVISLICEI